MKKFIGFELVSYDKTKDFGRNQSNRQYNHGHLGKIKEQWKTNAEMMPAIQVNVLTNHVIDGQHRLRAYQELIEDGALSADTKIKVEFYEVSLNEEKEEIINANTHSKNWSLDDYIRSYIKDNMLPYCNLQEWCITHPLCYKYTKDNETKEQTKDFKYRYAASILTGRRCQGELKSGTFNFSDEDVKNGEDVHAEMLEIIEVLGKKGYGAWIESLAVSWYEYRNMHPFKVWLKEMKAKKNKLQRMPSDNSSEWNAIFNTVHGAIDKKK